jgi:hypothetical protein
MVYNRMDEVCELALQGNCWVLVSLCFLCLLLFKKPGFLVQNRMQFRKSSTWPGSLRVEWTAAASWRTSGGRSGIRRTRCLAG